MSAADGTEKMPTMNFSEMYSFSFGDKLRLGMKG